MSRGLRSATARSRSREQPRPASKARKVHRPSRQHRGMVLLLGRVLVAATAMALVVRKDVMDVRPSTTAYTSQLREPQRQVNLKERRAPKKGMVRVRLVKMVVVFLCHAKIAARR